MKNGTTPPTQPSRRVIEQSINFLVADCHGRSIEAGWYREIDELILILENRDKGKLIQYAERVFVGSRLALIHSELSEALEGDRKSLQDDHLPAYPMSHVELADALIRLFDLAGFLHITNLGQIMHEKLEYNATRPDHKKENRQKAY